MLGKIAYCLCNGFQFIGGVLPLPTLRILPALFSLNAQILHQKICKVRGIDYNITRIDTFEGYKEDLTLYAKRK